LAEFNQTLQAPLADVRPSQVQIEVMLGFGVDGSGWFMKWLRRCTGWRHRTTGASWRSLAVCWAPPG
jgi:hypothetical protein